MDTKCVVQGEPVKGIGKLLEPSGLGKTILAERRRAKEEATDYIYEVAKARKPDMNIVIAETEIPEVGGNSVVIIPDIRKLPAAREWAETLPDDVIVICGQDLCHQITAFFRLH
ncbi:MAG: hypothetical protein J5494_05455 [Candidatus Methanomethylophilaceae archaeon]|nr:hypothetical protein [Candidatus Methanomethylophilaceae archaeon]